MICVFDVIEGPARGKRFWLRQDQRIEIGRISTADFAVPADHHMSRHHMIVEATVNSFRVRDVGSVNGTFVNNAKVTALDLRSGDRIRAGLSMFEVSLIDDDASPHARDGLALDNPSVSAPMRSVSTSSSSNAAFASAMDAVPSGSVASAKLSVSKSLAPQRSVEMSAAGQISLDPDDEDTQRLYGVAKLMDSVSRSSAKQGSGFSSSFQRKSHIPGADSQATELQASWCREHFTPTNVPQLFQGSKLFVDGQRDLVELLQTLDDDYRISAVLNVSHLGRFALQVVEDWRRMSRVLSLSDKLCLLSSDGSDEFWTLIRNAQRRDALVVFGSMEPLSSAWLQQLSEVLFTPSTLSELLGTSTEQLRAELLSEAEFVIFERDRTGSLGMLARFQ